MIFGHGEIKNKGIYIGHPNAVDKPDWVHDGKLNIQQFNQAVGQDVSVTLLTTACYSGGYLAQCEFFSYDCSCSRCCQPFMAREQEPWKGLRIDLGKRRR